ncbi:MAG: phenylalanine--tRNA ligase subunit beta [Thermoplasmatota archaeon]
MPVVSLSYSDLVRLLGRDPGPGELVETVSMMGCDVNRVEGDVVELEFFPNRPDLYSVEGVARALRAFLGAAPGMPRYELSDSNIDMTIEESVADIRPFVVCGVVRGLEFSDAMIRSLMDLQERLHTTMGRRRSKVSIGVHDLDRVRPPFTYKAVEPRSVRFVPLARTEPMDMEEILERHEKGVEFAHLVRGRGRYPLIVDRDGSVLSFPPIINGVLTQVTEETRNLFLDVTGTDYNAVSCALNIVATSLAERGGRLETVVLRYPKRAPFRTPSLLSKKKSLDPAYANRVLGTKLSSEEMVESLRRMMHDASLADARIEVGIPAFRSDIIHEIDLVEEVAIGHLYSRLQGELPRAMTFGRELAVEFRVERARQTMIGLGFNEMMTFTLTSPARQFGSEWGGEATELLNPVTEDQTILRTELLPSLLEVLRVNRRRELPQRVFEVGEVVVGHRNRRRLAAALTHPRASFTEAKSLVLAVLRELGLARRAEVRPLERPGFIRGRCAALSLRGEVNRLGWFGELHPETITAFELSHPVAGLEVELEGW